MKLFSTLFLALCLVSPAVLAESSSQAVAVSTSLQSETQNGVTYLCGGIGETELQYMKGSAARDYDLMLTFAAKGGNYIADVTVEIKDAQGKSVLKTTCGAPILLVDLPAAGGYRIYAESDGNVIQRTALLRKMKGAPRQLVFVWPDKTEGGSKR